MRYGGAMNSKRKRSLYFSAEQNREKNERSERHTGHVRMKADVPLLPSRVIIFTVPRFYAFVQFVRKRV